MTGIGTIVNVAAIIAGTAVGVLLRSGLPQRFKDIIQQAIGLAVVIIGMSGALQGIFILTGEGLIDRQNIMLMIFSLVIGGLIGESLNIEKVLNDLGLCLQKKFSAGGRFAEGFVTASLIYCVGAMAIVGAFEDGLIGRPETLYVKSILDGVISIVLAASMGVGVGLSALSVFIYQGGLTVLAGYLKPVLSPEIVSNISMVGSVLIMGIGINLLEIKKIKVGNLLPAIAIPIIYGLITK